MTGDDVKRQVAEALDDLFVGGVLRSGGSKIHAEALAALSPCVVLTAEEADFLRNVERTGRVSAEDFHRAMALLTPEPSHD